MPSILSNKWNPVPLLAPLVTCMSDSWQGFGFDVLFTDHCNTINDYIAFNYSAIAKFYRSWLRHYATSRKAAGSGPNEVDFFI
jgi:hypothetical protein